LSDDPSPALAKQETGLSKSPARRKKYSHPKRRRRQRAKDTVKESKDGLPIAEVAKAALKLSSKSKKTAKVKLSRDSYEAKIIAASKLIEKEKSLEKKQ